jgi:hypothetical protein
MSTDTTAPRVPIFISHASDDAELVEEFVRIWLEAAVGVRSEDILCTSLPGQGLRKGKDFKEQIRRRVEEATVVIAIITERYYASAFCIAEMGAAWVLTKDLVPCVVPPFDYKDLKAVLGGLDGVRLDDEKSRGELAEQLRKDLGINTTRPAQTLGRYIAEDRKFAKALEEFVKKRKDEPPSHVPRAHLEKAEALAKGYRDAVAAVEAERDRTRAAYEELKKAKDAEEVRQIERNLSGTADDEERLSKAIEAAQLALRRLTRATQVALYYHLNEKRVYVGNLPDDFGQAVADEEVKIVSPAGDDDFVRPNQEHARVEDAINALEAISQTISTLSPEFMESYRREHGRPPSLAVQEFWRKRLRVHGFP